MVRKQVIGGLIGGSTAAAAVLVASTLRARRRQRLVVTVYSEPGYQGIRRSFRYDHRAFSLAAVGLPRVGSIRVTRVEAVFRRAMIFPRLVGEMITDRESRAELAGWCGLALLRMADPHAWRREVDPEGCRQTWIRLWAVRPTSPPPPFDPRADGGDEPWCNILEDTPDLGAWGSRTRYVEPGLRNPYRTGPGALEPPGGRSGYDLPFAVVE